MSVSVALMGFNHAKLSVAFNFSQTIYCGFTLGKTYSTRNSMRQWGFCPSQRSWSHCLGGIVYPSGFIIEEKMPSCDHEDFLKPI